MRRSAANAGCGARIGHEANQLDESKRASGTRATALKAAGGVGNRGGSGEQGLGSKARRRWRGCGAHLVGGVC